MANHILKITQYSQQTYRLQEPIIVFKYNKAVYSRTIKVGNKLRLFCGLVSDDLSTPTHTITLILNLGANEIQVTCVSSKLDTQKLTIKTSSLMKERSETLSANVIDDLRLTRKQLIQIGGQIEYATEWNIELPSCVYDFHKYLTNELSRFKTKQKLHNEYFTAFIY